MKNAHLEAGGCHWGNGRPEESNHSHDCLHEILVLRALRKLEGQEQPLQQRLQLRGQVLEGEEALDGEGRVGMHDVVFGAQEGDQIGEEGDTGLLEGREKGKRKADTVAAREKGEK